MFKDNLRILGILFWLDFKSQKSELLNKLINILVWVGCSTFVYTYLMPAMGAPVGLINTLIVGTLGSAVIFEAFGFILEIVSDITGPKKISYYLTLTIPKYLYFFKLINFFVFRTFVVSIATFSFIKILNWNAFDISQVNYLKFFLIFLATAVFYGCFGLFLSNLIKGMYQISNVWTRVIFPMWFLGGFQFTWKAVYKTSKGLAYAALSNPVLYSLEGYRTVFDPASSSIPLLVSVIVLIVVAAVSFYFGVKKICRRLDCL